jgi:NitT/TauT family transport system ATP-binding protein
VEGEDGRDHLIPASVELLRRVEIFKDLGADCLGRVAAAAEERRFARGQVVYRAGDLPDYLYVLKEGAVSHPSVLGGLSPDAGVVRTPGELFGLAAVVEEMRRRVFTVEALEDCVVYAVPGARLREILKMDAATGYAVMQRFAGLMAKAEGFVPARSGGLSIRRAGKIYDPEGVHVMAVEDCTFDVPAGGICVVVGTSGCGKTTLLNAIAGFDHLTSGEIILDGTVIAAPGRDLKPGPDRIVVFQHGALFPWKTVLQNVVYGPVVQAKMSRRDSEIQARALMDKVGLSGIETQYPGEISSGMRRRVEIVRALINDPKILLLDEPFRALDALTKSVMHEYLLELYDLAHKTIFFITHDLEEAIFLADLVVVMTTRPGRVKKLITVDLPRPRTYRLLTSKRFLELKQQAIEGVHEEALKAFEAGERELA